jgi:hypothetical protein
MRGTANLPLKNKDKKAGDRDDPAIFEKGHGRGVGAGKPFP